MALLRTALALALRVPIRYKMGEKRNQQKFMANIVYCIGTQPTELGNMVDFSFFWDTVASLVHSIFVLPRCALLFSSHRNFIPITFSNENGIAFFWRAKRGHKNRMPVLYGTRVMRMVVKMLALFMADDDSINKGYGHE